MENNKTILLYNITPEELKDMIISELKMEIEKIIDNTNKPENYSVQEVSTLLCCSDLTTRAYIKKGVLSATKIGRKYIISKKSLEKALVEVKSLRHKRL